MRFSSGSILDQTNRILLFALAIILMVGISSFNDVLAAGRKANSGRVIAPQQSGGPKDVVYTLSNDPRGNAVLMYRRNPNDGKISNKPDGVFLTKGKGYGNPDATIGPQDIDTPLCVSVDKKYLFAVNMGSDDISAFKINADSTLTLVEGSPFPSNGRNPVSVAVAKNKKVGTMLFVANKAQGRTAAGPHPSGEAPNYTAFKVDDLTGKISPIPNSTRKSNVGASATQVLPLPNGKVVFGLDLWGSDTATRVPAPLAPFIPQKQSFIRVYKVKKDGSMSETASSPVVPPNPNLEQPFILGMLLHPTQPILYASLVGRDQLAVYRYDSAGNLSFVTTVSSLGVGQCWLSITPDQKFLIGTNTFDGTVETFDLKDPMKPERKVALLMREPGPPSPNQFPPFSSQPYQVQFDPTGKFAYFIAQRSTIDPSFVDGNSIHIMKLGPNGELSEDIAPVKVLSGPEVGTLGIFALGILVF